MVMKTCPTCRGVGHLQVGVVRSESAAGLVKVNPKEVLEEIKAGIPLRQVAKHHKISVETARVIGNGTWAGFRKQSS